MKPLFWVSALLLAVFFLGAGTVACVEIWRQGNLLTDPKLNAALGLFVSGSMFLAIGLRGWRAHRRQPPGGRTPR